MQKKPKKSNLVKSAGAPLGIAIRRPDTSEIKHKCDFLSKGSNRIAICGASGTGKSTILLELIPCFNNITDLLLCTSKPYDPTHTAIEDYCDSAEIRFKKLDNVGDIAESIEYIVETKKDKDHFLVIFDDISMTHSENDPIRLIITQSFRILRSFGGSMIIITQSYNQIPVKVRENLTHRFVFPLNNTYSIISLINDISGQYFTGNNEREVRKAIKQIYQDVYYEPFGWIMARSSPPVITWKWNDVIFQQDKEAKESRV
jgi:hypothetical protein